MTIVRGRAGEVQGTSWADCDRDGRERNREARDTFTHPAPPRTVVRLDTSKGPIDIEAIRDWSPRGADRFVALARHGYYDDTRFFRVTAGRWVQFGITTVATATLRR
ncbi:MAG TPA: peptidylprolyl isomerase [Vicinamibacterales bacterium]|nr:peptidylprolyl isomerase [Vicinamibacterales bacterium]